MYAIIKTGGKQFRAAENDILIVEKIDGEPGTQVELSDVLAVFGDGTMKVGSPFVKGAFVRGEIVRQAKGPKINAYNYKAKKNEQRHWGHRQPQTHIRVTGIEAGK